MQKNPTSLNSVKKSRRNGIKIQTSTTSSKIKKPAIIAGLTIVLLCCIFSTIAQATTTVVGLNRITLFQMYGYDSSLTTQAWRNIDYTVVDDNNLISEYVLYGQYQQRIRLGISSSVHIEYFSLQFDIKAKNISLTGTTSSYLPYIKIPQTSNDNIKGLYTLVTEYTDNGDTYRIYHVDIKASDLDITSSTFQINTFFSIVSTNFEINNFSFILNDEIQLYLDEFTAKVNDLNNVINGYQNKVDEFNERYIENKNTVLGSIVMPNAGYTVIPSILSATVFAPFMAIIGYAILSFILYGRK